MSQKLIKKASTLMISVAIAVGIAVSLVMQFRNESQHIPMLSAVSPQVIADCSAIAAAVSRNANRRLPSNGLSEKERCLNERSPDYKEARFLEMCQQAKLAGAPASAFSPEFATKCYGITHVDN